MLGEYFLIFPSFWQQVNIGLVVLIAVAIEIINSKSKKLSPNFQFK